MAAILEISEHRGGISDDGIQHLTAKSMIAITRVRSTWAKRVRREVIVRMRVCTNDTLVLYTQITPLLYA